MKTTATKVSLKIDGTTLEGNKGNEYEVVMSDGSSVRVVALSRLEAARAAEFSATAAA
jgi:hypothetical protein